jgi:hypothetical protein
LARWLARSSLRLFQAKPMPDLRMPSVPSTDQSPFHVLEIPQHLGS